MAGSANSTRHSGGELNRVSSRLAAFIRHEATAGLILTIAAALALMAANSSFAPSYESFLKATVSVTAGPLGITKPMLLWINDGLMAVFFFLVGLEIKREVLEGNLADRRQIVLPALAALGGMIVPALIYIAINWHVPENHVGWAVPTATDIAFALGALALAGSRVPLPLKVFLLTLATLDDLGAIIIIAVFYTAKLSTLALVAAGAGLIVLVLFNRLGVTRVALYIFAGVFVWVCVLKSGIHATLAGVALAFTIPLKDNKGRSLIHDLEEGLHPYVTFLILPLFAFANAGISFVGTGMEELLHPLALGIAAGLVAGKPIGIMLAIFLTVKAGLAGLPERTSWGQIMGVSCLAGIGFTMSLFIGMLAFEDTANMGAVRLGVIGGSLISMTIGIALLLTIGQRATKRI